MTMSRILAVLVAVGATGALGGLSQLPWSVDAGGAALIRFSWRATGERIDRCRAPTAEDLTGVPAHMQPEQICERGMLPFHLRIVVDGLTVADREIRASGAREDRPLYVFVEHPVEPGEHAVEVVFRPVPEARRDDDLDPVQPLRLDREIEVESGQIVVVSLTGDGSSFAVLGEDAATPPGGDPDSR